MTRAELVILPVVPVLLLLVFGSVVAAIVPFGVGLLAVAGGMASTFLLARVTSVSVYAPNVVTMIGLAVAIDYSLFIVSRYREEIQSRPPAEALGRTLATAGRRSSSPASPSRSGCSASTWSASATSARSDCAGPSSSPSRCCTR